MAAASLPCDGQATRLDLQPDPKRQLFLPKAGRTRLGGQNDNFRVPCHSESLKGVEESLLRPNNNHLRYTRIMGSNLGYLS